jgi:3'-phosphoadenosine 5'-phosphosulfate sulfotransferase (PAPS reductase)/FAD synthetase/ferredoxin
MYKITWDRETGGVQMNLKVVPDTLTVSPRPVFFEELDLLGLDKIGWGYPRCKEPIMWACNKQYFYRGQLLFEAKGANIYDAPTIELANGVKPMALKAIDVAAMIERNKESLFLIESEAIDFIRDTYLTYSGASKSFEAVAGNKIDFEAIKEKLEKQEKKKMAIVKQDCDSFDIMPLEAAEQQGKKNYLATKVDYFLASFSGGKDSQVILDLCTRAIPSTEFQVIYSDTGYEIPSSLTLYEQVQTYYKEKFPDLKFRTAKNHASVLDYWDRIGTPSDTHRWCCSVMKTAPLYRMLKVGNTNKQGKVLTFEGVRAEESARRSGYARIGKGVKHSLTINASPILYWNTSEVFLYLLKYDLQINEAYRKGMTRVGCLVCPFSSEWNDMVANHQYVCNVKPFLNRIEELTAKAGISDRDAYIKSGNWKRRAGGRDMKIKSYLEIISSKPDLVVKCYNPKKSLTLWLSTVADYVLSTHKDKGELRFNKMIYSFDIKRDKESATITFHNTFQAPTLQGLLKRALYKSTYCINCEVCEVECPTGALSILPDVTIDNKKCIKCHKCLNFHDHACVVADSLTVTGINTTNNMKLISYNNFGLNGDWLDFYMTSIDTYFDDNNHGLHPKEQLPNFVKWMVQAGIVDDTKSKNPTPLGRFLSEIYMAMPDLVWQVVWINLSYNSPIAHWYKEKVDWNQEFSEEDLRELVGMDYLSDNKTTIRNIVYALIRTFNESPIGNMGLLTKVDTLPGRKNLYKKVPFQELERETVAYSLFKFGEDKGMKSFRINDLYLNEATGGIYKEFGIGKSELEKRLRSLNSDENHTIVAELNMGLDHITLRDDISSLDVLKILLS